MSAPRASTATGPGGARPLGTGPGGKIRIEDIRSKLGEIRSGVDTKAEAARPAATYAAVGTAVALVAIAYLFGRRRGRRRSTWVEIRRL